MAIKVLLKDTSSFKEDFIQKKYFRENKTNCMCMCERESNIPKERETERETGKA